MQSAFWVESKENGQHWVVNQVNWWTRPETVAGPYQTGVDADESARVLALGLSDMAEPPMTLAHVMALPDWAKPEDGNPSKPAWLLARPDVSRRVVVETSGDTWELLGDNADLADQAMTMARASGSVGASMCQADTQGRVIDVGYARRVACGKRQADCCCSLCTAERDAARGESKDKGA